MAAQPEEAEALVQPGDMAVYAPEGKTFAGWAVQTTDAKGNITMTLKFTPDENGQVHLAADTVLEPMTLYALFE